MYFCLLSPCNARIWRGLYANKSCCRAHINNNYQLTVLLHCVLKEAYYLKRKKKESGALKARKVRQLITLTIDMDVINMPLCTIVFFESQKVKADLK